MTRVTFFLLLDSSTRPASSYHFNSLLRALLLEACILQMLAPPTAPYYAPYYSSMTMLVAER
jgi:hypothetical protein